MDHVSGHVMDFFDRRAMKLARASMILHCNNGGLMMSQCSCVVACLLLSCLSLLLPSVLITLAECMRRFVLAWESLVRGIGSRYACVHVGGGGGVKIRCGGENRLQVQL